MKQWWNYIIAILGTLTWAFGSGREIASIESMLPGGVSGRQIYLESFRTTYSVTLPLTNSSSSGPVARVHPQGSFIVIAPPNYGVMVVVQALRLRTHIVHADQYDTTYIKCRDLLKFKAGNRSAQVCGHVGKSSKEEVSVGLLGPRTFVTPESQMVVEVFVDHDESPYSEYGLHDTIAIELVITAWKSCPKRNVVSQFMKKITGGNSLRSCSPSEDRICINTETFCDGVSNCAIQGPLGHIAYDEELCHNGDGDSPPTRSSLPAPTTTTRTPYIGVNKPYSPPTGAVISPIHLILIFSVIVLVIFGACTWLAKANEKKFQHTMYRFSTLRRNRRNGGGGQREDRTETLNRRPSAPPVLSPLDVLPEFLPGFPNYDPPTAEERAEMRGTDVAEEVSGATEEPPPYDQLFPTAPPPNGK